jgi:hypothetical protein
LATGAEQQAINGRINPQDEAQETVELAAQERILDALDDKI